MTTICVYVSCEKPGNVEIPGSSSARLNTGFTGIGLEAQLKEWPPRFLKRQNYNNKKNDLKYFLFFISGSITNYICIDSCFKRKSKFWMVILCWIFLD